MFLCDSKSFPNAFKDLWSELYNLNSAISSSQVIYDVLVVCMHKIDHVALVNPNFLFLLSKIFLRLSKGLKELLAVFIRNLLMLILNILEDLAHAHENKVNQVKASLQSQSALPLKHPLRVICFKYLIWYVSAYQWFACTRLRLSYTLIASNLANCIVICPFRIYEALLVIVTLSFNTSSLQPIFNV